MPIAAAVAARTHRVRIGTQVLLLPLYNAVRLAEDAATVDAISGGRLIFGAGLGYRAEEFEALGIPMRERLPRFLETLEVIRRAWEEPSLTFHGRFYDLDNVTVTPKPVQKPRPEIWIGASNEHGGGILKKCVNSQAVYPLSEQHGLKARERRYTAHEEGKHWE